MTDNFAARWRSKSRGLGIDVSTLVSCGMWLLPREAPPMLRFDRAGDPALLWDVLGADHDWSPAERERFAPYRIIGSDGAGNPICTVSRSVVILDLDSGLRKCTFMNRGVPELAECLLAFMGESDPDQFRSAVLAIDPDALSDGTFWESEARLLGKGW